MGIVTEKALQNIKAMYAQAKINSATNTDEQALQVASLYPEWSDLPDGTTLTAGERVNHNGILYNVLQTHQKQSGWTPEAAPSLFAKVLTSETGEILPWEQPDSTNPYMKGDRVTCDGYTWESAVDNNVWQPGAVGTESLWLKIEV